MRIKRFFFFEKTSCDLSSFVGVMAEEYNGKDYIIAKWNRCRLTEINIPVIFNSLVK